MIPEQKIEEVLQKADIVSVISKYAQLEKHGKEYLTLCLFHNDASPSMHVSPDKKIFKCFSCGVGGNVITFLQKYKQLSFTQAVVELANEFNVDLGDFKQRKEPERYTEEQKKLFEINEEAMKYYQALLNGKAGVEAKKYLENRNILKDDILRWNIGFAFGNDSLIKHLLAKGYIEKDLINAGVATLTDSGIHDYYVRRIIFPIRNIDGFVTGFSGRTMGDEKPKYVNTRETLVFKKSNILFNIDEVWKTKERFNYILVLEGFMDVISLNKIDIPNAIALMGTSLSKYHVEVLKGSKKPIKLFLDGDEPGVNAMYKNSPKLIANKVPFTIVNNETVNDPDELVQDNKIVELKKMINNSMNAYDYFLNKWASDKTISVDKKIEIANKIFYLLQYESDILVRDAILNDVSTKLNLSKDVLDNKFNEYAKKPTNHENFDLKTTVKRTNITNDNKSTKRNITTPVRNKTSGKEIMNARVFLSLVNSGQYIEQIENNLSTIYPSDYVWQLLISKIISYYKSGMYEGDNSLKLAELLKHETNQQLKAKGESFVDLLSKEKNLAGDYSLTDIEMKDIIRKGQELALVQENEEVYEQVQKIEEKIEQETNPDKKDLLNKQKSKLFHSYVARQKQIDKLRKQRNED